MVAREKTSFQPDWRRFGFLEGWAVLEASSLAPTLFFWGLTLPRGDGTPVITVPGFCEPDAAMLPLRTVLRVYGYDAKGSGTGINAKCLQTLCDQLVHTITETHRLHSGRRVVLITHSLGELVAESACQEVPDLVAARISLAAPKRLGGVNPLIIGVSNLVRRFIVKCETPRDIRYTSQCTCRAVQTLLDNPPVSIPRAAFWTVTDGVVDPKTTVEEEGQGLNIQIPATHSGMIFNPIAYLEILRLLKKLTLSNGSSFA